jgi:transposase
MEQNAMDKEYLESLVEQGLSTRDIAKKENKSQTSVRHWLKKYSLKTKNKSFKDGYTNKCRYAKSWTKENQNCSCCGTHVKFVEDRFILETT